MNFAELSLCKYCLYSVDECMLTLQNPFANPSDLAEHLEIKEQLVEKIELIDDVQPCKVDDS